jgi:hypothetical protein
MDDLWLPYMTPAGCSVVCGESSVYLGGTAAPPPCALVERDGRWLSRLTQHYDLQAALHVQIEYHPMATGWRRPATAVLASPSGALAAGLWRCHRSLILHSAIVDCSVIPCLLGERWSPGRPAAAAGGGGKRRCEDIE